MDFLMGRFLWLVAGWEDFVTGRTSSQEANVLHPSSLLQHYHLRKCFLKSSQKAMKHKNPSSKKSIFPVNAPFVPSWSGWERRRSEFLPCILDSSSDSALNLKSKWYEFRQLCNAGIFYVFFKALFIKKLTFWKPFLKTFFNAKLSSRSTRSFMWNFKSIPCNHRGKNRIKMPHYFFRYKFLSSFLLFLQFISIYIVKLEYFDSFNASLNFLIVCKSTPFLWSECY